MDATAARTDLPPSDLARLQAISKDRGTDPAEHDAS